MVELLLVFLSHTEKKFGLLTSISAVLALVSGCVRSFSSTVPRNTQQRCLEITALAVR